MTIALVQSASQAITPAGVSPTVDGVTLTLGAASTVGNLLVVAAAGNATAPVFPVGWAALWEDTNDGSDPTAGQYHALWWKISAGETSVAIDTDGQSPFGGFILGELSGASTLTLDGSIAIAGWAAGGNASWPSPTGIDTGVPRLTFLELSGDDDWGALGLPAGVTVIDTILWNQREMVFGFRDIALTSPPITYTSVLPSGGWRGFHLGSIVAVTPPDPPEPGAVLDPPGEVDATPVPIADDIIEWTIRRGAAEQVTGAAPVGSATVKLRNTADKYNPENASSPLIAYLRDGTAIHISVNKTDGLLTGSDPAGLFGGRITDITPMPMGGQDTAPFVEFQCEDALGWLGRTPITVGFAVGRSQGDLRDTILAAAGETRVDLANEILTMPLSSGEGSALELLEELNRANGTRHFVKPATAATDWYTYTTYNRQHGLDGSSDATLTDSDILVSGIAGWRLSADTVVNQQKASTVPIRFTPSTYTVWRSETLPIAVKTTRPFEVWVDFDDYVRAPLVNSAYSGSTPTITLTPFGTTAKLTITVASGTCTFTSLSIEGALARRLPAESWVADDLVSQVLPRGVRSGAEISGEYVGTLSCARGIAEHVVWRYATPLTRPTLTIANWFSEMFDLDIGDIISVTFDALGVTAQRFEIVGLTHHGVFITTNRSLHTVEYVLQKSRAQTDPDFFVLDADELDDIPVLAY